MVDYSTPQTNILRDDVPAPPITLREMTMADMLTDVGWLGGQAREDAKARYLASHGQYFENGRRYTQ